MALNCALTRRSAMASCASDPTEVPGDSASRPSVRNPLASVCSPSSSIESWPIAFLSVALMEARESEIELEPDGRKGNETLEVRPIKQQERESFGSARPEQCRLKEEKGGI